MSTFGKFVVRVVVLGAIFWAVAQLVTGIRVAPHQDALLSVIATYLWIGFIFALVNTILGPVIRLVSLPFVWVTLGLFLFLVNAALLGITAALTDRLQIDDVWSAVAGGFLIALFSWGAELLLPFKVRSGRLT